MARPFLIPAALIATLALGALPVIAQDAAPVPPAEAPMAKRTKPAEIRLDFGAGRKVAISCGDAGIEACLAAAAPVIEKVATTAPVQHAFPQGMHGKKGPGKDGGKGGGKGWGKDRDHDRGPKGAGPAETGADAPPPPPPAE